MNGEPLPRLILDAMTLRGLGPYLEGTRLEVRPLTILCGKNGSGKSTWLKMLNLLQRSQLRGLLPFAFDRDESVLPGLTHHFSLGFLGFSWKIQDIHMIVRE